MTTRFITDNMAERRVFLGSLRLLDGFDFQAYKYIITSNEVETWDVINLETKKHGKLVKNTIVRPLDLDITEL